MLKVYTDNYDGHSLRTLRYFPDEMPKITRWLDEVNKEGKLYKVTYVDGSFEYINNYRIYILPEFGQAIEVDKQKAEVDIINSIQKLYKEQRQNSKAPSFAMQYFCEPITLHNNQGFSMEKSIRLHTAYHEMYGRYFEYIDERLNHGSRYGYVLLANGVRLDTPALFKGLLGTNTHTVDAEYRSAGNAISQSYGSLNTRAARRFMERVWDSKYRYSVFVFGLIHDAIYILAPKDAETINWVNKNLIECMCDIQDYQELHHPIVHLEAEMDIRQESWAKSVTVPNNISIEEIKNIIGV